MANAPMIDGSGASTEQHRDEAGAGAVKQLAGPCEREWRDPDPDFAGRPGLPDPAEVRRQVIGELSLLLGEAHRPGEESSCPAWWISVERADGR